MVMTMPDLGKYGFYRSKYPVHYIFIPHNMLSTHMVFRENAFDQFDAVFCVGPHHKREIREAEKLYSLPPKKLLEVGYAPLDKSRDRVRQNTSSRSKEGVRVIIAPSWQKDGILDTVGPELIKLLLKHNIHTFLRPHRHSPKSLVSEFQKKFNI